MRFLKHYGFTEKCSNVLRYGGIWKSLCSNLCTEFSSGKFWKAINISRSYRHE